MRISKAACFLNCFATLRYAYSTSGRAVLIFLRPINRCMVGLVLYMGSKIMRLQEPSRRRSKPMIVREWPGC